MEGACYVLAFDLLQERKGDNPNLTWIRSGLACLRCMIPKAKTASQGQLPITRAAIEQMVRSVIPDFELRLQINSDVEVENTQEPLNSVMPDLPNSDQVAGFGENPTFMYPSMPFGFDLNNRANGSSSVGISPEEHVDFTAADIGWNIDFGTMDMEAFLSIDPNQNFNFAP